MEFAGNLVHDFLWGSAALVGHGRLRENELRAFGRHFVAESIGLEVFVVKVSILDCLVQIVYGADVCFRVV